MLRLMNMKGAADGLSLAAAPTFAVMALVSAVGGSGPLEALCASSPLAGMTPMYLLMTAFHAAPWLRLISFLPSEAGEVSAQQTEGS